MASEQRTLGLEDSPNPPNDDVARLQHCLREVLSVAVVTLWKTHRDDTEKTFSPEELYDLLAIARPACADYRRVETVYRDAYDYLLSCSATKRDVNPPATAP